MPPSRKNWFRTPCPEPSRPEKDSGRTTLIAVAAPARPDISVVIAAELPRSLTAIIRATSRKSCQQRKRYPNPNACHQNFPFIPQSGFDLTPCITYAQPSLRRLSERPSLLRHSRSLDRRTGMPPVPGQVVSLDQPQLQARSDIDRQTIPLSVRRLNAHRSNRLINSRENLIPDPPGRFPFPRPGITPQPTSQPSDGYPHINNPVAYHKSIDSGTCGNLLQRH